MSIGLFRKMKRDREAAVAAGGHFPEEVHDQSGMPHVVLSKSESSDGQEPRCPSYKMTLKLLFMARFFAVVWSTITDCDETFNYWEPLHFLLYGKGFQVGITKFMITIKKSISMLIFRLGSIRQNMVSDPTCTFCSISSPPGSMTV